MSFRKKAAYRVVLLVASVDETLTCDHSFNLDLFIMLYKEILRTDNNFIIFLGGGGESGEFYSLTCRIFHCFASLCTILFFFCKRFTEFFGIYLAPIRSIKVCP